MHHSVSGFETLTPVIPVDGVWIKRDDLFCAFGVNGGKARGCLKLAQDSRGGLVTAAARKSPQGVIVAAIARGLSKPCRIHTASGSQTPEMQLAIELGAEVVQHRPGYSSVIQARSCQEAAARGWTLIPFGMESQHSIDMTAHQVVNIPRSAQRLLVPVGSGITLAGILWGLRRTRRKLPVIGVVVGADPTRRLEKWAPPHWRPAVALRRATGPYAQPAKQLIWGDMALDPLYEAKCIPFLKRGDCLWVVGHRGASPRTPAPPACDIAT